MLKEDSVEIRKKIAEIIQEARHGKKMSIEDLAAGTGYSPPTIIKIEQGIFSPGSEQLFSILSFLGIEVMMDGNIIIKKNN